MPTSNDFPALVKILWNLDPMGLHYGQPDEEEYAPEAELILPKLGECNSISDVHKLVYRVFVKMFGKRIAGHYDNYYDTAYDIWHELLKK